jgi:hypothetical protein
MPIRATLFIALLLNVTVSRGDLERAIQPWPGKIAIPRGRCPWTSRAICPTASASNIASAMLPSGRERARTNIDFSLLD